MEQTKVRCRFVVGAEAFFYRRLYGAGIALEAFNLVASLGERHIAETVFFVEVLEGTPGDCGVGGQQRRQHSCLDHVGTPSVRSGRDHGPAIRTF